ncbi:Wzz/FepE/Etk N-terminal domain-containing protein [Pseudomonas sp. BP8]|uniref:Wzz/FepE/Etk N-terminal domain-containing protein n=1 Tax=Pseudomonas sp. BP8 TaxID=2817864 RepID=UPI001AE648B6|nr:Wzz/FepE/Etk N-terminal domain-containing protein [Pseudomonas sp. BP8]MBP2263694.1 chain length determinant protein (polysaccharide antigen chain regulator) [Pseudomonas sp. BP8]HDS1734792.1 LPS O-antigen chain length determinant protein WzzB [Pseudomonas putida]
MRNDRERQDGKPVVDLVELIEELWKQKWVVAVTTVIVTLLGVAYALLATPLYEAKVFIQSPSQNDIAQLNYGRGGDSGLPMLSVKTVYESYVRNIQSESLRRQFYRDVYLKSLPEDERRGAQDDLYARFNQVVSIPIAAKETPGRFQIVATSKDPQQAADWVVRYAQLAGERAKKEVMADVRADALVKAGNLKERIRSAREEARKAREDRIARLSEALIVAQSIGLEKPPIISGGGNSELSADMEGSLVYMRGSRAIEAEIKNLRARVSDDPFVDHLRQNEETIAFYEALQVDPSVFEVYRQDGGLDTPDKPVKPQKVVIVVLSALLGGLLGILIALYRAFFFTGRFSRSART